MARQSGVGEAGSKAEEQGRSKLRARTAGVLLSVISGAVGLPLVGLAQTQSNPGATAQPTAQPTAQLNTRFTCESVNGEYTVMYNPQSQPGQSYAWAKPGQMGGGWSADRRCAEISRRLESYRPNGLEEMKTSTENGYNIVCVTTQADPSCRIVLTVPEGQDPNATRDRVFSNLTIADSGEQTAAVNTYTGNGGSGIINQIGQAIGVDLSSVTGRHHSAFGSSAGADSINLRPFLDRADGGTGEHLK
jgi:Circadian oscillating protein COP23